MIKNCSKCKRIINQKSINVGGLLFHPECFVCAKCNKKINGQYNLTDKKFILNNLSRLTTNRKKRTFFVTLFLGLFNRICIVLLIFINFYRNDF